MKTVFCFAVVAAVLSALAGPARSLPLAADGQIGRWKRQGEAEGGFEKRLLCR